jgi:cytochrome c oxidase cbb3-type subunit 1
MSAWRLYVAIMFYAGWLEGANPAFSFMPGTLRNGIYLARLLLGILILVASIDWFFWAFKILPQPIKETA